MTTGAGHRYVCARERELRVGVVIECRWRPGCCCVTRLAGCREHRRHVVGILRRRVILHVAVRAVRAGGVEVPANVAVGALELRVGTRKGKVRLVVVEGCGCPRYRRMAELAGGWYSAHRVVRVLRTVVVLGVATEAIRARTLEFSADMTCRTFQGCVRTCECEAGELQVIEFRRVPGIHARVAHLAVRGESRRLVVWLGCLRVRLRMTRVAVCGKAPELSDRCPLMASIAFEGRVRSDQWEAIEVLTRLLQRNLPALDRVAGGAVCSELPLVNVRMAISALRSHVREDRTGVALHAGDLLVHAQERILRFVVIEFRLAADRFPTRECVAVVAGDVQRSVRASRFGRALLLPSLTRPGHRHHQRKHPREEDRHVPGTTQLSD